MMWYSVGEDHEERLVFVMIGVMPQGGNGTISDQILKKGTSNSEVKMHVWGKILGGSFRILWNTL